MNLEMERKRKKGGERDNETREKRTLEEETEIQQSKKNGREKKMRE